MATTGYGRISSINRIPYYKGSSSRSSRTYRGVKTKSVVSDITTRMAKAQDMQMANQYAAGQISLDSYLAYLSNRVATTSDPTYNAQLTKTMQDLVTGSNEKTLTDGYAAGTVTAGQVADYFKNKLTGIDPNNPLYAQTQDQVAKWENTATKDAYAAQEAILQGNYDSADNKLPAAQALLDYNLQMLPQLQKGSQEYNAVIQKVGSLQSEVKKLTNEQNLLSAEDKISQMYPRNTSQDLSAKSQLYAQLRDQAAANGDITNYYKYDQMANSYTDRAQAALTKEQGQQISDAIRQVHADYISGKIDGATAQAQLQEISLAADGVGNTSGVLLAHDLYNTIQSNLEHGVIYGADNGFGKTKGGGGSAGDWFDLSTGTPLAGVSSTVSSGKSGGTGSTSGIPGKSAVSSMPTGAQPGSFLDSILSAAHVTNPSQDILNQLSIAYEQGATFGELVDQLRVLKVGTGDGWKALSDVQKANSEKLNSALSLGYDPTTGLPFTTQEFQQATLSGATALAMSYSQWQSLISTNPNYKISINGSNTKIGTLADTVDKVLNGSTKIDPATGLETKDTPGLLDTITNLSNNNGDNIVVENPKAPGTYLFQNKAAY